MPVIRVHGADLYYEDTGGSGEPVLFLHGFLFDGRQYEAQSAALRGRVPLPHRAGPLGSVGPAVGASGTPGPGHAAALLPSSRDRSWWNWPARGTARPPKTRTASPGPCASSWPPARGRRPRFPGLQGQAIQFAGVSGLGRVDLPQRLTMCGGLGLALGGVLGGGGGDLVGQQRGAFGSEDPFGDVIDVHAPEPGYLQLASPPGTLAHDAMWL